MLLIAGDCDPVGDYGSGVRKVWAMLGDAGVRDLTCQILKEAATSCTTKQTATRCSTTC